MDTTKSSVHTCHRCGWPFPNPHPSSKHRRAHNRICGTIEGYTNVLINSSQPLSVSDDDQQLHSDEEDNYKTPSPKIEKRVVKESGGGVEEIERSNKSEDDLFSDAVTEFSDTGISPDMTNLLESPLDIKKVNDEVKVVRMTEFHTKDADKTEENDVKVISNSADSNHPKPLVKDTDGSSDEIKFSELVDTSNTIPTEPNSTKVTDGEEAVYVLSVPSDIALVDHAETLMEDFKDHKPKHSNVPLVLDSVGNDDLENRSVLDTFETKTEHVKIDENDPSESVEFSLDSVVSEHKNVEFSDMVIIEEAKVAESQSLEKGKTVNESTNDVSEANVKGKVESDHENVSVSEVVEVNDSVRVLTENPVSEKHFTQETVKEPESVIEMEQKIVAKDTVNSGIPLEKTEESHNASRVLVNEAIPSLDCGVDASIGSSSRNSLEGNWGSVSVLSTASIDTENTQSVTKSEVTTEKSRLGKPESLVELKEETFEGNESEGRKRNEEAIAKVKNWSTVTAPIKNQNLVSEAKAKVSNNPKPIEKDEKMSEGGKAKVGLETARVNQESTSEETTKNIGDQGKKSRKKGKGKASWMPFVCCSSSANVS